MRLAWHWTGDTLRDGRALPAIGETLRYDGPIVICTSGLHASERILDALQYAPGPIVHRVKCSEREEWHKDKFVCRERTILWSHRCSDDLLRGFARAQARSVLHLWDAPEIVRHYLEIGDENIRAAAGAAAWAAAGTAAWAAAGAAAWAAAGVAAWAAARDAAGAAARAAAGAAAGAAAWAAADKDLQRLILEAANQSLAPEGLPSPGNAAARWRGR